jgi:hypothetical protein
VAKKRYCLSAKHKKRILENMTFVPAKVDRIERYEDMLTPAQRRDLILDKLAAIARRLIVSGHVSTQPGQLDKSVPEHERRDDNEQGKQDGG